MGNQSSGSRRGSGKASRRPTKNDLAKLAETAQFSLPELQKLLTKYDVLSNSLTPDGKIDLTEFRTALGLKSSGFSDRLFAAFDTDGSRELDFYEFINGLSALSPRGSVHLKAVFCFRVYDIDGNGTIERDELREVLRFSLEENSSVTLSDDQMSVLIDRTYRKIDTNGDGVISLEEFEAEATRNPQILNCVMLNLDTLLA